MSSIPALEVLGQALKSFMIDRGVPGIRGSTTPDPAELLLVFANEVQKGHLFGFLKENEKKALMQLIWSCKGGRNDDLHFKEAFVLNEKWYTHFTAWALICQKWIDAPRAAEIITIIRNSVKTELDAADLSSAFGHDHLVRSHPVPWNFVEFLLKVPYEEDPARPRLYGSQGNNRRPGEQGINGEPKRRRFS